MKEGTRLIGWDHPLEMRRGLLSMLKIAIIESETVKVESYERISKQFWYIMQIFQVRPVGPIFG